MTKIPVSNITALLRGIVERVEKLNEEKADITSSITDVYREAKSNGLEVKTVREIVKLRKISADQRAEQEFNREVYMKALGMADELA